MPSIPRLDQGMVLDSQERVVVGVNALCLAFRARKGLVEGVDALRLAQTVVVGGKTLQLAFRVGKVVGG